MDKPRDECKKKRKRKFASKVKSYVKQRVPCESRAKSDEARAAISAALLSWRERASCA